MGKTECFLRCEAGRHPDILLPDGIKFELGRGPVTKVKDSRCSRVQVVLVTDLAKHIVVCQQMGGNSSRATGRLFQKGDIFVLNHMDRFELLSGQFAYTVIFNPSPPQSCNIKSERDASAKDDVADKARGIKRSVSSDDESTSTASNPAKKPNIVGSIDLPWYKPERGKVFRNKDDVDWMEAYEGKVLLMRTKGCKDSDKIAAFDLDGTIISTSSGKVFPVDKNDWKILLAEVPGKLKSLHHDGFKIVIITNQAGISRGKLKVDDFIDKAHRISARLGVPLQLLCSTAESGFFRKPRPGIWYWLQQMGNSNIPINNELSFYCGDAAGRDQNWMEKRKKDFSCSDRLFALNVGIKFFTPEELFLKQKPTKKYTLPEFNPRQELKKNLIETKGESFFSEKQEMVLLVGIQGSGKSHVAEALEKRGYVVASNDRCGGKEKCLRVAREAVKHGRSVVVDNTHRDKESRKEYIALAKSSDIRVRSFIMTTSHHHARHNNLYRELTDSSHTIIKEPLFNSYRSKFEEPVLDEGFASLVKVNFVPEFPSNSHQQLYQMYLLEK